MTRRSVNAAGYEIYADGDSVRLVEGRPFSFVCCCCGNVHDLRATADDGGVIMQVNLNDEETRRVRQLDASKRRNAERFITDAVPTGHCQKQRTSAMAPTRRYTDDDRDVFDERGIIRPGKSLRVPLPMMDSQSGALVINTGLQGEYALSRQFYVDGTKKVRRKDKFGRIEGEFEEDVATVDAHRPGFRQTADAGQQLKDAAYLEMCSDLSTAWMSPEQRAPVSDTRPVTADTCPAGVDPRTWEYERGVRELCDAWKSDWDTSKIGAAAPKILPLGAVPKHIGTVKAGDACTVSGADGVYVDGGDGNLYCRPRPMKGNTPVPPTNRSTDAQPGTRAYVDQVWRDCCEETANAWKAQG
jgi:hypothetical protein